MGKKFRFTEEEKNKIEKAVQSLEAETSGEMVPYIVPGSDSYIEGTLYSIIAFLIIGIILVIGASMAWLLPSGVTIIQILIFLLILMGLGFSITYFFPALRTQMVSNDTIERRVMQRAGAAFLDREVFNTKKRIGILLFISVQEKKVVILADAGINKYVDNSEWQHIVDDVIKYIKKNNTAEGIVSAIEQCAALLIEKGYDNDETAGNQLPDGLIEGD